MTSVAAIERKTILSLEKLSMGARKLVEEKINALLQTLPDVELEGVLVYMESISSTKRKEEYEKNINEIVGKFRDKISSSEEFSRRKAEEKKLDR